MPLRIEIKSKVPDARSVSRRGFFNSLGLKNKVSEVNIIDAYTVDAELNKTQIKKTLELLANPVTQQAIISNINPPAGGLISNIPFDFAIEISFLPGVTDNVGNTAKETIRDGAGYKFKNGENVYFSQVFLVKFKASNSTPTTLQPSHPKTLADALYNPLIQKANILSRTQYQKQNGFKPNLPKVKLSASKKVLKVDLNISEKELTDLGKLGIADANSRRGPLALSVDQLKAIGDYFKKLGRSPTDIELETLAQTWSEHCKHIIFTSPIDEITDGLYKHYIKGATEKIRKSRADGSLQAKRRLPSASSAGDFCVSVFSDNSGAIAFDDNYLITHKVETHNTPSALDPFGGAITGIVGVNRDALGFGLGAKPVINTYGFCLAEPWNETELYRSNPMKNRKSAVALSEGGKMLSARRIMDGVVAGINAGGNQSGIPTNSGFLYFDPLYRGKPLVFAGTVGLIPREINKKPSYIKKALKGDYIVMLGGRVGLDGIHGATFSSETLNENSPAAAVQIGDPITQKKFTDAVVREARGLYNSITDCGAGGLSSAVGEMAQQSGDHLGSSRTKSRGGCEVELNKVPLKYPGLSPWQIWISESQERMILAVPPKNWKKFQALMKNRGVEASVIGKFTNSDKCVVKFAGNIVMDLDLDFLHNGMPKKKLTSEKRKAKSEKPNKKILNLKSEIINLLASPNITSNSFLASQYDHEVQGGSVTKPLQGKGRVNADAAITRPLLTSNKGVVLSSALYPEYSEIDPYHMAGLSIDSAIAKVVCAGANPDQIALLDNFCWCSPQEPERLWQLKMAAKACYDFAVAYNAPFISGKDSMHNDFNGYGSDGKALKISIPPTLLISAIGIIENIEKSVTLDLKQPGDVIYLLGLNLQPKKHSNILQNVGMSVEDASKNISVYHSFYKAARNNLISSAISVGRGGLAIALCKMAIGGQLGISVQFPISNFQSLSPLPGQILATVCSNNTGKFEKLIKNHPFTRIGIVKKEPIIKLSTTDGKISIPLNQATKAYHSTFKNY